jgi:hypothetical protein
VTEAPDKGLVIQRADVGSLPVQLLTRAGRPLVPVVERFVARLMVEAERKRELLAKR